MSPAAGPGHIRRPDGIPTSEAQIGLETALPAIDEALAVGIRPGLSNAAHSTGQQASRITTHDVLDVATLQGARTNGLAALTGSLTPGKKADVLVIQAQDLNNMPLNDPIGTVVLGSDARNISSVLADGEPSSGTATSASSTPAWPPTRGNLP